MSAGKRKSSLAAITARCEDPESNQTSKISVSFLNSPLGECGEVNPSGKSSLAVRLYQAFEPSLAKICAMCSIVSGVTIGVSSSA